MKFVFPLLILLLMAPSMRASVADTLPPAKTEHQVFINTTFFIKQILNFSNTNIVVSPYILGYKCFPSKHHGFRMSIGGSFSNKKEYPDSTFVRIQRSGSVDVRAGYEYRYTFGKFWTFFCGADVVGNFSPSYLRVNNSSDIVTTKTNGWSLGAGPVVGIQINVHKHISLFTETAFYYTYGRSLNKLTSVAFPELNTASRPTVNQNGQFLLPTSIYFVFKF
ncbi:MAG: hypothetical protein U0V74_01755 [Chitinophagales bacterium]